MRFASVWFIHLCFILFFSPFNCVFCSDIYHPSLALVIGHVHMQSILMMMERVKFISLCCKFFFMFKNTYKPTVANHDTGCRSCVPIDPTDDDSESEFPMISS
jgi:hypothetical protein